ncbi:hypothetical protein [Cylindrospermum sp. FACHB-282]|uniref:hypothetical protein n=1 Tax=Cylindrospermum sp. FACHB-282 TaxID=2692794 RepID=UPI0016826BE9|nr:hypothetical protein [Cylindrospermum sp. FACHB-282]MBD2385329.1 hypothetical protein [Cylindrospermum sp. FACHB-282]
MLLIIVTYHGYEKYCNYFLEYLNYAWPNHPEIWFLTDGKNINHPNVITVESDKWLIVLYSGLKCLKDKYSNLDYAYLLLEDLIPLDKISESYLSKLERTIYKNQLNCVSFLTYNSDWEDKRVYIDNLKLYSVPQSFPFYSQLQPAIWNMEHLLSVCEYALDNSILDPWQFERIVLGDKHYVSEYPWPSVLNGLLHSGQPNWQAIRKIKTPEGEKLRNKLIKDYFLWLIKRFKSKFLG